MGFPTRILSVPSYFECKISQMLVAGKGATFSCRTKPVPSEQNHVFEETIAYNGIRLQYDNGKSTPYGEKTRPGRCSEPELITQRPLMINQAREVFCQGRLPASLIYVLVVSPWPAVPSTFMPLPFRNTSAGPPVVLDTALLPCSFLPPAVKETRSDSLCPTVN